MANMQPSVVHASSFVNIIKKGIYYKFSVFLTWRPLSMHSHQPSRPLVFCSKTVRTSPLRKASSSGVSAMLSYKALATQFYKKQHRRYIILPHTMTNSLS